MQQSGVIETKKYPNLSIVQYTSGDEELIHHLPTCSLNIVNQVSITTNESRTYFYFNLNQKLILHNSLIEKAKISVMFLTGVL